jgi:hypothetical protein
MPPNGASNAAPKTSAVAEWSLFCVNKFATALASPLIHARDVAFSVSPEKCQSCKTARMINYSGQSENREVGFGKCKYVPFSALSREW